MTSSLKENIEYIRKEIVRICEKYGRNPKDVTLIGVTKTKSAETINEAVDLGLMDIGENYVQELREKYSSINPVNIHFIGHLQSNKARYVVPVSCLIHSTDSISLIKEINRSAEKNGKIQDILIEINISGETAKNGIRPECLSEFTAEASEFENVRIQGLMGMAPITEKTEETRVYFAKMKQLFDTLPDCMRKHLSMGMSGDFREAIAEGATIVRIGTSIFGRRN